MKDDKVQLRDLIQSTAAKQKENWIRVLVYGETGVGKTHFAGTFPSPFIIDTDRGLSTLADQDIPYIEIKTTDQRPYRSVKNIMRAIVDKTDPFDESPPETLVIDGLSALCDLVLAESMRYPFGKGGSRLITEAKPEFDDWAALLARMRDIVSLSRDLPCHVVMTAGVATDKDEARGGIEARPLIQGSFRHKVGHMFDEVYYMDTLHKSSKTVYQLHTRPFSRYSAKSRLATQHGIPDTVEDPSFESMFGGNSASK